MKISGSFLTIQEDPNKITKLNEVTDYMHFDVMDGKFTENPTLPFEKIIQNTIKVTNPKDIHLMVNDIKKYVDITSSINPDYITFHKEASKNILEDIKYIKDKNIKAGVAINPETDVNEIIDYLKDIDLVLVMSVHPGKGGQKFIDIEDKINKLTDYRNKNDLNYIVEVDGGINDQTINKVKNADLVVVGSFITNHEDFQKQVNKLKS